MKAMIFAAGLGTRLKPLTDTMPKALLPLAGKPLLQWQVEKLRDAGITDIIVNVHHFADQIIDAIRANNGWGCNILISDERDELLDTGGGLKKAISTNPLILSSSNPILACNVDILSNLDLRILINQYNNLSIQQSASSLLVVSDRPTQRYLLFDDHNTLCGWTNIKTGEIRPASLASNPLTSKPLTRLDFSGCQILSPETLDLLRQMPHTRFSLIDFYLSVCEKQMSNVQYPMSNLKAFIPTDYKMMDVGKIEQLNGAECFAQMIKCIKSEKK